MDSVIFNPLEEYEKKFLNLHNDNVNRFFEDLLKKSGVDVEENRKTVDMHRKYSEALIKLKRKFNWMRFLRVMMCISLVLIPVVVKKTTPKIKEMRENIADSDKKIAELLEEANKQMLPLNSLFTDRDCLTLIEQTIPLISFASHFSSKQEADMRLNYDFDDCDNCEQSTLDVLSGNYNENPFLFENKLIHTMGEETYHGYKTIHWTETYRDSNGKLRRRTVSQTLHATVTKPKPFYHTQVVLNYCSQGAPDLYFSRDASHLDRKSEKALERYIKRGEGRLKRKTNAAIRSDGDFMSMSNSDFEVLFDALDRTNEVQFRTLFTPLAQTNMTALIVSKTGYGDDFNFIKAKRTNKIISTHSQGRAMKLMPENYISYSFDIIKENFTRKNTEFFRAVYFDFAPLLAIPAYQERPVHSLKPIPDYSQLYSMKEYEVLANAMKLSDVAHPDSKTKAILKSGFLSSDGRVDNACITAYSYDIEKRTDIVSVYGGDGHYHNVPVDWDEYIPLTAQNNFSISDSQSAKNKSVIARHDGLCIFKS